MTVTTPNATATCATATWTAPTASDNCSTPSVNSSQNSGFCFSLGTNTVTYTATDARNNTATCSFTVQVNNFCATDNQPPVLSACPANITVSVIGDTCYLLRWTAPTATDNCSTPSVTSTRASGFCFPLGINTVIYTATDAKNNMATCSFTVEVRNFCASDIIPPVIKNCPRDTTIKTTSTCAVFNWQSVTVDDNCGNANLTSSHSSGSCFALGITTVLYTATDNNHNTATCTFKVNVIRSNKVWDIDATLTDVRLYPNPTKDEVFLKLESTAAKNITIRLYGITGKIVCQENRKVVVGANQFAFDLKILPNAIYFLQLYENERLIHQPLRFVKM